MLRAVRQCFGGQRREASGLHPLPARARGIMSLRPDMLPRFLLPAAILSLLNAGNPGRGLALAQSTTVPLPSVSATSSSEGGFPDAVTCDVRSPEDVHYRVIFYKSQTVSFGSERNNAAEYGTTFIRAPDKLDLTTHYKWRLQLGKPGNITVLTLPSGWTTEDCPLGKSIAQLTADKQVLRLFAPP